MIALFDIDHVLSDAAHRDSLMAEGDWDAYHANSAADAPVKELVSIVNALTAAGAEVVLLTARPEKWRTLTMGWLARHEIAAADLLMRPDDDYRAAPLVKLSEARRRFGSDLKDVAFIVDDREDVLQAFSALGITTLLARVPR